MEVVSVLINKLLNKRRLVCSVHRPCVSSLALAFVVSLFSFWVVPGFADGEKNKGVLWRIERPGVPPSYILGTAHVSDPRITSFRPELKQILNSVESISLEIDLSLANQARMAPLMMNVGGDLEAELGEVYFSKLVAEMARLQIPPELVSSFKPWAAALAISLPLGHDASQAMDALIYRFANQRGTALYALETIEEQVGVFEGLTPAQQIVFLKLTIDSLPVRDSVYQRVLTAYLESDLEQLSLINEESMIFAPPDLLEALMYALLDQRNQRMVERMQARLREGRALIAVGALHLPGERGLLSLLRARGFDLSPLY